MNQIKPSVMKVNTLSSYLKSIIQKLFCFMIFILVSNYAHGQSYEKEFKVYFAWEVKQLDEFIERFNDDEFTFIKGYIKKTEGITNMSREVMIKKLFNTGRTNWNYNEISTFIKQVNDKESPQFLDSEKGEWFANVRCITEFNGKPMNVLLKLKLKSLVNGGAKWVIEDVSSLQDSGIFGNSHEDNNAVKCPSPVNPEISLNPMSHAIDFMNIDLVTNKPDNIGNFVDTTSHKNKNLNLFIDACLKKQLKVLRAMSITYDFYQIKGWRIEVKQFNRQSKNSGWLISRLVKIS